MIESCVRLIFDDNVEFMTNFLHSPKTQNIAEKFGFATIFAGVTAVAGRFAYPAVAVFEPYDQHLPQASEATLNAVTTAGIGAIALAIIPTGFSVMKNRRAQSEQIQDNSIIFE